MVRTIRLYAISAALFAGTVVAEPGASSALPAVEFVVAAKCAPTIELNGAQFLAGRFVDSSSDSLAAYRRDDRRVRYFKDDGSGCFKGVGEIELPWAPQLAAKVRQSDGTETIYFAGPALVAVKQAGRVNSTIEISSLPGTAVEQLIAPHTTLSHAELAATFQSGAWFFAEQTSNGLRWNKLAIDSHQPIHAASWHDGKMMFLGSAGSFASALYALDFATTPPTLSQLKRIALFRGASFAIASVRKDQIALWSAEDSSLWDLARDERGPFLRLIKQLPNITNWAPLLPGRFFEGAATTSLLLPYDSTEGWLFSDAVELVGIAAVPRRGALIVVGDFAGAGRDELLFISAEGAVTRLRADRRRGPASEPPADRAVCRGYSYLPGITGRWPFECPRGYGVLAVDDSSSESPPSFFGVDCCPLPRADVLQEDLAGSYSSCPEGSIATSGPLANEDHLLRCTKVSPRYLLGEETPGIYWGDGFSLPRTQNGIERLGIPERWREGIGRESRAVWDVDGCIGSPPGTLLTGFGDGRCGETRFRALLFAGAAGDPPRGTPVNGYEEAAGSAKANSDPSPSSLSSSISER